MKLRVVVCCVVVSFVVCFVFCVCGARACLFVLPLLGEEFHDVPNYTAGR